MEFDIRSCCKIRAAQNEEKHLFAVSHGIQWTPETHDVIVYFCSKPVKIDWNGAGMTLQVLITESDKTCLLLKDTWADSLE